MLPNPLQLQLCALIRLHGSLGGAAEELGLTPAAVTAQVNRAERDWAVKLVERGPRGARLTDLGHLLADAGASILATAEHARQIFDEHTLRAARRLRIGTFQTAAEHLLPPALTALRHRREGIDVSMLETTSANALKQLTSGVIDVAVVADHRGHDVSRSEARESEPQAASAWRHLLTDPLVLCLPDDHSLLTDSVRARGLPLGQLRDQGWILVNPGNPARDQFDQAAAEAGFQPRIQFETDNYGSAQALVATGIGVAAISRLTVRPTPGATHVPLYQPRLARRLYAVTRRPPSELTELFVELLLDTATDLEAAWESAPSVAHL